MAAIGNSGAAGHATAAARRWLAGCLVAGAAVVAGAFTMLSYRGGSPDVARAQALSVTVVDRNDRLLRAYTTRDGQWRLPATVEDVDARYLKLLLAYEDKRFYRHPGVDAPALVRSGWQLASRRRIVSGGSTITMQVARLLDGEHDRTATGKLRQIVRALQLEWRYSKREILDLYIVLAPFGGNIEGVRAASLAYLGKEPKRLTIAEAALLVAIPQAPASRRPDRFHRAAHAARDRVLARVHAAGAITVAEYREALGEPSASVRHEFPKLAAHLADREVEADPGRLVHRLTIDARAQTTLEAAAREQARSIGSGLSAALVAVEHASGAIIAHVGSSGYFDSDRAGAVDMTRAVRSPGSTLKPFIYGLAFEAGLAHPETLIEDRPQRFGAYNPKNFDHDFHGTVTIREALAQSLNIPAVKVLDALTPGRLHGRLTMAGVEPVYPPASEPTLAIALGGLGLRLEDLAQLYTGLARLGDPIRIRYRREAVAGPAAFPVLSPSAAWAIGNILRNAPAPVHARGGQIAYKTGTSYGARDAWSAGYDGRHTIAVWVGRPDGAGVPGLSGRQSAAPLLFDAFHRLSPNRTALPPPPAGVLAASGADLPPALRRFRDGQDEASAHSAFRDPAPQIAFPVDRSEVEIENGDSLNVRAEGGALPLTWLVDGAPVASDPAKREVSLEGLGKGAVRVSVIDAKGRADRVVVRVR
jgi:penicillin-binding protein 1C